MLRRLPSEKLLASETAPTGCRSLRLGLLERKVKSAKMRAGQDLPLTAPGPESRQNLIRGCRKSPQVGAGKRAGPSGVRCYDFSGSRDERTSSELNSKIDS
jgi:hypothetical protein